MKLEDIHIGDRLLWTDPEHPNETPDPVTVVGINGEVVSCQFDCPPNGSGYGMVEAFAHELERRQDVRQDEDRQDG